MNTTYSTLNFTRQQIATAGLVILFIGLVASRIMISVGMIILISNAVLNPNVGKVWKRFWGDKMLVAITSIYLMHLLSGLMSDDMDYFLERLRIKLPFLLMPFAFAGIEPYSKKQFSTLAYLFIGIITVAGLGSVANYLIDYQAITDQYSFGKVMPTPISHIRFSLLVVFATVLGFFLFKNRFYVKYKWEQWLIVSCTLFLFAFIHLLAVRTGLLALYIVLLYMIIKFAYDSKKIVPALGALLILVTLPVLAYNTVTSFQNKVHYATYDLMMYFQDKSDANLSDGGRIISWKAGMAVGNQNPWLGVGIGDLLGEMNKTYESQFPQITEEFRFIPHNQFVTTYAAFGLVGLLWFSSVFFYPLFYRRHYRHVLMVALHLIVFTSFLSDATIENQIGTAFYLIFLLTIKNYYEGIHPEDERSR